MKKTLFALAIMACASAAFATNDNNPPSSTTTCTGTGNCSGNPTVGDNRNGQVVGNGQIANGGISRANSNSTSSATTGASTSSAAGGASTSTSSATGGAGGSSTAVAAGGQGGSGGSGGQGGSATGGSATGGSATGGSASVGNTSASIGNTTAVGGSVGNTTAASSSGGNTLTGGANTSSVNGVAGVNGGINISTVDANSLEVAKVNAAAAVQAAKELADVKVRNTPNAGIANLTSSNDTCMGSVTAGGSAPGIGLSFGTTYKDDNCVMLKNSRELWNMGMKAAALALMCTDKANRDALEVTGYTCPQTEKANKERVSTATQPQYTDPIVRARMGLAPL